MGRKNQDPTQSAPVAPQVNAGSSEQIVRYVVVRDGHRVSSQEYAKPSDPKALDELAFWRLVENNNSWGAPVKVVQYDNYLHRVFSIA